MGQCDLLHACHVSEKISEWEAWRPDRTHMSHIRDQHQVSWDSKLQSTINNHIWSLISYFQNARQLHYSKMVMILGPNPDDRSSNLDRYGPMFLFRLILSLAYIDSHSTRQQQSEHGQLGTKFTQSSMCKSTSSIEASCSNCRSFSKEQDQRPPWLILFMLQALLQVILYRCEVFQLELK